MKRQLFGIRIGEDGDLRPIYSCGDNFDTLQDAVAIGDNRMFEVVPTDPDERMTIWCNEEGRNLGAMLNPLGSTIALTDIRGPLFITGPADAEGETLPIEMDVCMSIVKIAGFMWLAP